MHDLPHPGLLPKEKENPSPPRSNTCDWIFRTIIRETRVARLLFPLLGGEGQGEGERFNKLLRAPLQLFASVPPLPLALRGRTL